MKYSLETVYEIWDDHNGTRIEVGPDRDNGLMTEIRFRNDDNSLGSRVQFTDQQLPLLIEALQRVHSGKDL